jgi:adenylate cyclase, class 2
MPSSNYTETEVKLYVPDLAVVARKLEALGAELSAPRVYEYNVRYENEDKTLASRNVVLRLRQDTRARLTYKEPPPQRGDDDIPDRFEAEVEVSDFDAMETILNKLGFTTSMVYEKYRTTYKMDDVEIVLDELPYGHFVEIEGEADDIRKAVEQLELKDAPRLRANYISLFENVRQNLKLDSRDLTFEAFKDGAVHFEAFRQASTGDSVIQGE